MRSVEELIGRALPDPVTDFMDAAVGQADLAGDAPSCACTAATARAARTWPIALDGDRLPRTDAARCVGCSFCAQKCFAGALAMRDRTPEESRRARRGDELRGSAT